MILYALALLLVLAPLTFHLATRFNRRGRLLSRIPGPTAYPLVGNLLRFNVDCLHEFWKIGREISDRYYPITRFWLCRTAVISVRHPDDLEILFSSPKFIDKGYIYEYLHPWLKTGLLTSTGEKWRHRRKILTPAFHFSILRKYLEITDEEGKKFVDALKAEGDEIVKDLMPFCSKYTLNIICESAMGVSLDSMDSKIVDEYKEAVHHMGNIVLYRMPRPFLTNWMMNWAGKMGRLQRDALKVLHGFTDNVIRDRKEYHRRTSNRYLKEFIDDIHESYSELDKGQKKRLAMLDLLLAAEHNGLIDDAGIKEEVDTFTFEAHDTTGMAMTFALMLLAENEEAQSLARAEVTELLERRSDGGGPMSAADLQELNYLERCIKESLRLFPPVSTLLRYSAEELQLKNALIPADSHIMIHVYDTHRDPNFWQNPDKFDPDRFLPENSKNRHAFAYVPFSAGPRNCIGQKFAMMELKSLLGRILYDFRLEPVDRSEDMRLMADIVVRPLDPVRVRMIRIRK